MFIHVDERLEHQPRQLCFNGGRIGVREERIEIRRIGGDIEAHYRSRRGRTERQECKRENE